MDIILIAIIILALISAISFNHAVPIQASPEWNPLEILFQGYLGWDIFRTTVFCAGSLLGLFLVVFVIGKITGWSRGMWFDQKPTPYANDEYNSLSYEQRVELGQADNARVKGSLLKPAMIIITVAFFIALLKM
jgi:hypothetical protein